jgi:hypothetical protein
MNQTVACCCCQRIFHQNLSGASLRNSGRAKSPPSSALNRAFHADRVASDTAWRKVKPFKRADEAVVRYLSAAEARRLVNACVDDFRIPVQAAATLWSNRDPANVRGVKDLLGNASFGTTEKYYIMAQSRAVPLLE